MNTLAYLCYAGHANARPAAQWSLAAAAGTLHTPLWSRQTHIYQTDAASSFSGGLGAATAGMRPAVHRWGNLLGQNSSPTYGLSGLRSASSSAKSEDLDEPKEAPPKTTKKKHLKHFCNHPDGCTTRASFGIQGTKMATRCSIHKEPGMVDVINRRCDHPDGCTTQPLFGLPGSKAGTRCSVHKDPGMVDVRHRRCDYPDGCKKQPLFGLPSSKATRCSVHKEPGMVNVRHRRCDHPDGCMTQPSYGLPGADRATRCYVHKDVGMEKVKRKRRE